MFTNFLFADAKIVTVSISCKRALKSKTLTWR